MATLFRKLTGRHHDEPERNGGSPIIYSSCESVGEDDWERERRKEQEARIEEEYAERVRRIEDEYGVLRRGDDQ